jgi:hypothetical protein
LLIRVWSPRGGGLSQSLLTEWKNEPVLNYWKGWARFWISSNPARLRWIFFLGLFKEKYQGQQHPQGMHY